MQARDSLHNWCKLGPHRQNPLYGVTSKIYVNIYSGCIYIYIHTYIYSYIIYVCSYVDKFYMITNYSDCLPEVHFVTPLLGLLCLIKESASPNVTLLCYSLLAYFLLLTSFYCFTVVMVTRSCTINSCDYPYGIF